MKNTWSCITNNTWIYFSQYQKKTNAKKKNLMDTAFVSREECFIQVEELKFKNWIKG